MKCDSDQDPFELSRAQTRELIRLAHFTSRDLFYDLGCASGKVVIEVVKRSKVKRAIGIDNDECQFCKAWPQACKLLKKRRLWFIDFRLADMQTYDYSDASIIYQGTEESAETITEYRRRLGRKHARIITKDLPLVGFMPAAVSRKNKGCWLFLTKYPLTRTNDLDAWTESVLGRPGNLDRLYRYYRSKLAMHYPNGIKYHDEAVKDLKRLVDKRFGIKGRKEKRGRR